MRRRVSSDRSKTSEVSKDLGGLQGCLLNRPGGDQLVDLLLEAVRLLEGDDDLAVVGHVVVGEGPSFAVLEPLVEHLVPADVELPLLPCASRRRLRQIRPAAAFRFQASSGRTHLPGQPSPGVPLSAPTQMAQPGLETWFANGQPRPAAGSSLASPRGRRRPMSQRRRV